MTAKKYVVKNIGEIDSVRLADEFERAWYQRREIALRKYESARFHRPHEVTIPDEEEKPT